MLATQLIPISRAVSPVSTSTITSEDSNSTILDLSSSDPILCYNTFATYRTRATTNTFSEQDFVPSTSEFIHFDGEPNNVSNEEYRNMIMYGNKYGTLGQNSRNVLNKVPINTEYISKIEEVVDNDENDERMKLYYEDVNDINSIGEEMEQDSNINASLCEEGKAGGSRKHSRQVNINGVPEESNSKDAITTVDKIQQHSLINNNRGNTHDVGEERLIPNIEASL